MASDERQFVIENFLGGIHEEVDSSLLKATEAAKAQNMNIDKGVLSVCNGIASAYATPTKPLALMSYYQNGIENLVRVALSGTLYKWNTGTLAWDTLGAGLSTTADRYDYINNNVDDKDVLVFTNGVDNVKIYDGTTLRDLKKLGKASTAGADNTLIGKYLVMHYERLWIADDNSVYASSATRDGFDIEDFTTPTDETEVNMHGFEINLYGSDGKIIGMAVIFDDVVIFKERSIHKIFGSDPSNYTKINFAAKGGISDKSIAVHETGAFFVDHSGIYFYDGTNVNYISRNIEDTWKALDKTKLNRAIGFMYDDKYVVAVCEGTSTVNNLVIEYDIGNKNFMFRRGLIVETAVGFNKKAYLGMNDVNIYEYDTGTTYNGSSIAAYWESGYTDLGMPEATKEISSLYVTATGTGTIRVTITTERGSKYVDVPLEANDKVYPLTFIHRGRIFKIRIENIFGCSFTLKTFKILYELDID